MCSIKTNPARYVRIFRCARAELPNIHRMPDNGIVNKTQALPARRKSAPSVSPLTITHKRQHRSTTKDTAGSPSEGLVSTAHQIIPATALRYCPSNLARVSANRVVRRESHRARAPRKRQTASPAAPTREEPLKGQHRSRAPKMPYGDCLRGM